MVDISISKEYLAKVFCLVVGYEITTLLYGSGFWGSQVFMVFLIMYLLHEPAHAFMALWYGIDVFEINLGHRDTHILFASVDEKDPHKNEIEGMIYGAGFAVDVTGLIFIIFICTKWAFANFSIASVVPILFALIMSYIFLCGLNQKGSDYQVIKEKFSETKKDGA
jgi:hypothetical protein